MGLVTLRIEADELAGIQAYRRLNEAQQKAAREAAKMDMATQKHKRSLDESANSAGRLEKAMDGAGSSARAMITGMLGIGSIVSLAKSYIDHLGRIKELQQGIAEGGLQIQQQMLSLAEQEGNTGRAGLMATMRNAFRTAQAGSIPIETAGTIRNATQSFFKFADKPTQEAIAGLVSQAIGKTGGTGEEGAALAQLLKNMGVKNVGQAREAMAKINQSLTDHPEMGAGKLAMETLKGGIAMGALGGGAEDMLAYSAQGRIVTGSADEGAELMRQVLQNTLGQDSALKIVQQRLGLPSLDAAREQPANVVMKAMGDAISGAFAQGGPAQASRLLKDVEGRTRIQLLRFFSPEAVATGQQVRAGLQNANVGDMDRQYAGAAGTDVAVAQRNQNERVMRRAEQAHERFRSTELFKDASARLEELRASGDIGFFDDLLSLELSQKNAVAAGIEAETLGLRQFDRTKKSKFAGAEIMVRETKRRAGIPVDQPVLDRSELTTKQLMGLQNELKQSASAGYLDIPAAGGGMQVDPFAKEQIEAIGGEIKARQAQEAKESGKQPGPVSVNNHYGDVYHLGQKNLVAGTHPFEVGVG